MQDDRLTPEMAQAMDRWLVYGGTGCDDELFADEEDEDTCEHGVGFDEECEDCEADDDEL